MSINERVLTAQMSGNNSTDANVMVYPFTEKGVLVRAYIANLISISADNTNNITVSATQNSQAIFSRQTNVAGGALGANAAEQQAFDAAMTGELLEMSKGDVVTFAVAEAGTGPAYDLHVVLVYKLIN